MTFFDGVNDRLGFGDPGANSITDKTAWTVEFMAKISEEVTNPTVFAEGFLSAWSNKLLVVYYGDTLRASHTSRGIRIWMQDAASVGIGGVAQEGELGSNLDLSDGIERHVAVVQRAINDRELYIDSVSIDTNNTSIAVFTPDRRWIGAHEDGTVGSWVQHFKGNVSLVRAWDKALTVDELTSGRGRPLPANTANLVFQKLGFPLIDDASESWADSSLFPFFDGVDDTLNLGDVHDQTGSYTIEAEINPSVLLGVDNGMRILSKDTGAGSAGWALSTGDGGSSGRLRHFNRAATGNGHVDSDSQIVANTWQHVAATFNFSTLLGTLYYDGVQVAQASVDAAPGDITPNLMIGAGDNRDTVAGTVGHHFDGRMRNVRLWNVARSAADILANIDKAVPAGSTGLLLQRFGWETAAAASSSWSDV